MIWVVLSIACLHLSAALVFAAWLQHRVERTTSTPRAVVTPVPVKIGVMPASNHNATRRFVALDAIAACRDSASRVETRRARASFLEATIAARLLSETERGSVA